VSQAALNEIHALEQRVAALEAALAELQSLLRAVTRSNTTPQKGRAA
jgi:hypothetical protein